MLASCKTAIQSNGLADPIDYKSLTGIGRYAVESQASYAFQRPGQQLVKSIQPDSVVVASRWCASLLQIVPLHLGVTCVSMLSKAVCMQ